MKTAFDSSTKARAISNWAVTRIHEINTRLTEIAQVLRDIQLKRDGVILLELYDCSRNCLGCPHPRWIQWKWHKNKIRNNWIGHRISGDPIPKLKRSDSFADTYAERLQLSREVKSLIAERSSIIKRLSDLDRIRNMRETHRQPLGEG